MFWRDFTEKPLKLFKTHEHDNIPRSQSYEVWSKPERERDTSQLNIYMHDGITTHTTAKLPFLMVFRPAVRYLKIYCSVHKSVTILIQYTVMWLDSRKVFWKLQFWWMLWFLAKDNSNLVIKIEWTFCSLAMANVHNCGQKTTFLGLYSLARICDLKLKNSDL